MVGRPSLDRIPVFSISIPAIISEVGGQFDPENMLAQPPKHRTIPKKGIGCLMGSMVSNRKITGADLFTWTDASNLDVIVNHIYV